MKRWKARSFWPLDRVAVGSLGNRPSVHCLYSAILDNAGGLGLVVQPGAVVMCVGCWLWPPAVFGGSWRRCLAGAAVCRGRSYAGNQ